MSGPDWRIQHFGTNTDLEIQDGWLTPDADGKGFTVDYGKIYQANDGNIVIYDSAAPVYKDSILEFDVTVTGGQAGRYQVAFFPRFVDGKNCDGMAIDGATSLQESYQVNGSEGWPGVPNPLNKSLNAGETYHLKMVTVDNTFTVYVDDELLTTFTGRSEIPQGKYGFRVWTQANEKTVHIANIQRTEFISSTLGKNLVSIKESDWGNQDVTIPVTFGEGDHVKSISNGGTTLTAGTDYTVSSDSITLKKEYIAAQNDSFTLDILFDLGSDAVFSVGKLDETIVEYVWTPDKGVSEWKNLSGNGTFAMTEEDVDVEVNGKSYGSGMRITGAVALMNTNSPVCMDGEVELTYAQLNDDGNAGVLFRAADGDSTSWQGVWQDNGYMQRFYFKNSANTQANVHGDCSFPYSRMGYADHKLKIRMQGSTVTIWMDDQFVSSTNVAAADASARGQLGIYTGGSCDILLKKAVFRNVVPFVPEVDGSGDCTIEKNGMTVRLADNFPRVKDYTLNGKKLSGTQFQYDYVTINTVDYPAAAEVTASAADSVTYTVTPEGCDVTFDVKFTVLDGHVLEMRIQNIDETTVTVNSIGFPNQPLISANSNEEGAKVDASAFAENMYTGSQYDQTSLVDRHYTVAEDKMSKTVSESATIVAVTNNGLSASMANNVLYNIHEFQIQAFDLPDGSISAGAWNTEFVYRGLDGEKILPIASEPDENDLYCRIVVTEDTNDDGVLDWQDGANGLKTIIGDKIPGGDTAARSFFHVGYNFVGEAQQPFLKIADNMKRLSNLIDGFGQILVFKGYANEGHDSGHADYNDVNKRAGGPEDMQTAASEVKNINSLLGIHINNSEAYPEAKMFNWENMTEKNAWAWMDQSKSLRREVYILNGGMDQNLDSLFEKVPDIGFVYVDTYGDDRWSSTRLADNLIGHGAMMGTENKIDLDRYVSWVHWPDVAANSMHSFVYHTQKDVYNGAGTDLMWGGYGRSTSMMSWQHNWNVNNLVEQFYTNQLPQKYLMCHDVRKMTTSEAIFEGGVRSVSDRKIYKDDALIVDGAGKIFIPWYAEDSKTRNPDEAAKIYHWNSAGGDTTWTLPQSWQEQNLSTVKLYKTTQTGKVFVADIPVADGKVTINAAAKTPYVVYPGEAAPDTTDWSTGSPIKDTSFNSRDFSIWQKSGDADIQLNDDGNGVSILTISGQEAGQVSQTMTGLTVGQKYRVVVWAGAANGKTARLTVKQGEDVFENYVEQTVRANDHFDTYAKGKWVDRIHVDFTATAATAQVILSADACESADGKATFMETRILKTADPGAPTDMAAKKYAAYETFEYIEEGGTGIFTPEGGGDGGYHLSETHLPYTSDTIPTGINGEPSNWSLKMYGYGRANMRTYPASMRLLPNMEYTMEFDVLGNGNVSIVSERDSSDQPLSKQVKEGHNTFTFTTGNKTDYIARLTGINVLDNFQVYYIVDETPPTTPGNVQATVDGHPYVTLTWDASTDSDSDVSSYKIFRDNELIAVVPGTELTYTDQAVQANSTYQYQISAVNGGATESSKSAELTVEVGGDTIPPEVISATLNGLTTAAVVFDEKLDVTSAETTANYQFAGTNAVVTAAKLQEDSKTVVLTLNNFGSMDTAVLTVTGVKDISGNAIVHTQPVTLTALVRYYKFDETEGTAAIDAAGNENGVKSSTVKTMEGKKDKAAQFTADGYVEVNSGKALYHQNEFTISAWIYWNGTTGESQTIFSNGASGDASSYGIWFHVRNDSKLWCSFKNNNGGYTDLNSGSITIPQNQWVHVAFVKRADGSDLYLGGEKVATSNVAVDMGDHNSKFRIGGNYNAGNSLLHKFKGGIDDFKIFIVALTVGDIQEIATEGMPPQLLESAIDVIRGMEQDTTVQVDYHGAGLAEISEGENVLAAGSYTVTQTGIVLKQSYLESLALGEHTLTLTFDDEANTTDELTILVRNRPNGVYLSERFIRLDAEEVHQMTAETVMDGESAVTWTSSDPSVATVDQTGKVTAAAAGTAVITAKAGAYSASATVTVNGYLRSWYNKPASNWTREALPIGNGNLSGMVFGKTDQEQVQVNEITLWAGGPKSSANYTGGNKAGAANALESIQQAMFDQPLGQFITGVNTGALLGNETGCQGYQNLGDITMNYVGKARTTAPENYLRELNIDDSVVRVSYDNDGVHFTREYFTSYPGNVMVIRLTADQENALGFTLAFTPDNSNNSKTFTTTARDGSIFCQGKVNSSQMAFAVQLKVIAPSATLVCNDDGTITVTNGEEVLILMSAGTNYDITESKNIHEISDFQTADGDYLDNDDPNGDIAAAKVDERIKAAAAKTYGTLLQDHMDDYHEIYGRVTLDLGDKEKAELTTDALLKEYRTQRSNYAETLLFQYGRYLLLSSSRDSLPANLQGIWNNSNNPGWNSDYHFNVNIQMNYWPAFVTNMAETAQPLVTYLDSLRNPGNVTAREHFGTTNGWVVNTEANPFGKTAPGSSFSWGFTPGSGAWACLNLWDYYEFTQDPEVLKQIYPILKESAQFWLEYLVEDPRTRVDGVEGTGELVTAPGGSSEHGGIGVGTTYDMSLAYMEMQATMEAAKLLGADSGFCEEIQSALDRMHPFSIGTDGQLKEWREETGYSSMPGSEALHRHLSHLLALQPGNLITKDNSDFSDYYDAAVKALLLRDDGSSAVGWSMAQKGSMFARTKNGEMALHHLNLLLNEGIADNLWDIYRHPAWGDIFQVDANMGYTAAVAEMLLQSHQGYIEPLPALPEAWADGSYTGLVARGNFETDAEWANGSLTKFTVRSGNGGTCVIRYPNISKATVSGADVTIVDENTIRFETTKGSAYVITGIPEYRPVKSVEVTSPSGVTLLEKEGQTIQLTATVAPDTASNRNVTWKVVRQDGTEPDSVTIDQNGVLTATGALARETVRVTATAKDGSGVTGELRIAVVTDRTASGARENVALNRPVSMTGATIYGRDDLKLSNINDGNHSTRMAIAGDGQQDVDIVFEFQLDGVKTIDEVDLYEYLDRSWGTNGRIDNISVQIPDGDGWKEVASKATPDDNTGDGKRQLQLTFDPVETGLVCVIVTDNEKACPTIWELEIYGTEAAVEAADKDALIAKLNEAAGLTEKDFTEEDWEIFVQTRTDAIKVANHPAAVQNDVDAALAALTKAMKNTYTVTFESNGGSTVAAQTVTKNGKAVKPADPAKDGYTFGGWYTDAGCTTAYDFDSVVTGDLTLYANWIPLPVDKSALANAINSANAAKDGVVTSDKNADEVDKGVKFVTEAEMKALNDAITAAQTVLDKADATQAEVNEAVSTLNTAVATFQSAIKTGTYEQTTPIAPPTPVTPPTPPTTTETKENEDGTTTTIVTDNRTGTVTETTEKADGSVEVIVTETDGTVTETVTDSDGGKTEKVIDTDKNVTITVTDKDGEVLAKAELPAEIPAPETRFADVLEGHWADEAIHNMAGLGLVNGVGDNRFNLNGSMTRGDLATILFRAANGKAGIACSFEDIPAGAYYADAVAWAAQVGIVTGYSDTAFGPKDTITREQLAVMLCRFAQLLGVDTSVDAATLNSFADKDSVHDWAADAMAWCVANGILNGVGNNTLAPTNLATRAQVAVMLDRFVDLLK